MRTGSIPRGRIAVLGLITIAVYGSWFYSFGVLLDPIIEDTGWSEPSVAAVFGASTLIAAFGSLAGGWLLDLIGSRAVFVLAALLGGGAFLVAADAGSATTFAVSGAIGGATFASLGFYHVTKTVAVRISTESTERAIAVLTIWGAFASAIFIPLTAWLVTLFDWRMALRVITLCAALALLVGAMTVDTRPRRDGHRPRFLVDLGEALRDGSVKSFLVSQGLAGLAVGTVLVYQVPAMTSAGLVIGAASFWAGFRGFAQLGGRLPLMWLVRRWGVGGSLRISYFAIAIGAFALAFAGNQVLAAIYAIAAGFGIGAVSPLVGMYSSASFGESSLGAAMGFVSLVFLITNAIGPVAAAWVADLTGSRSIPVAASAAILVAAAVVVRPTRRDLGSAVSESG